MLFNNRTRKTIVILLLFPLFFSLTTPAMAFDWPAWDKGHQGTRGQPSEGTPAETPCSPPCKPNEACSSCSQEDCNLRSPVVVKDGNFLHSSDDCMIPGRIPLQISRSYNSMDNFRTGLFGYGWTFTYGYRIIETEDSDTNTTTATLIVPVGQRYEFTLEDGIYTPPPRVFDTLTKSDNTFTLRKKNGTVYQFDGSGNLTSIIDRNGNSLTFALDSGVISTIADDAGRQLSFSYGANGKIAYITDPAGRMFLYEYDGQGNLIKYTDPMGGETLYDYDGAHNLIAITDPRGNQVMTINYDEEGRVSNYTDENGEFWTYAYVLDENDIHKETHKTDSDRNTWKYIFNDAGQITRETDPLGNTLTRVYNDDGLVDQETNERGQTLFYEYDDRGNTVRITDPAGHSETYTYEPVFNRQTSVTDRAGNTTRFEYDANGNRIKAINALNQTTEFTYDPANGDLLRITNANGKATTFAYDAHGYVTSTTDALNYTAELTYDVIGSLTVLTDPSGAQTRFAYDDNRRPTRITDALGGVTAFEYDENGNRTRVTDALSSATTLAYDEYNRLESVTDALDNATAFTYDTKGNLLTVTDPNGNTTRNEYDALSRLVEVRDALGYRTEYSYDEIGNLVSTRDAEGNTSTLEYDDRNRLIRETDALEQSITYAYDVNGNLTRLTDGAGNSTTYAFDALDRLIAETYPDGSTVAYAYDPVGNLGHRDLRSGERITYAYDVLNRPTRKTYPDGTGVDYAYDAVGRITSAVNADHAAGYAYDPLGRLTRYTQDGRTVGYEYDALGNRTRLIYPDNTAVTYAYDVLHRLTQIQRPSGETLAEYAYDGLSRRTAVDLANGTGADYQYDRMSRLTRLTNAPISSGSATSEFSYSYNRVGQRTAMSTREGRHSYGYDDIYQLIRADYPGNYPFSDTEFNFDAVGNRTTRTKGGETTDYDANALNQYVSVNAVPFSYDGNGNLTGDGTNFYEYDPENRLIRADVPGDTVTFTFDAFGRRRTKTGAAGTVDYLYDGDQVIAEYDGSGGLVRKFVYGTGIDEPILMETGGARFFYHFDGLGSVTELTDGSGSVVERYAYDVYGGIGITDDSGNGLNESGVGNPYFFTGRRLDIESGLYYYRARMFSAELGKFIQVDPINAYTYSVALYIYAKNNPTNLIDPDGYQAEMALGQIGKTAAEKAIERLLATAAAASVADGPLPIADAIAAGLLVTAAAYDSTQRVFVTYTMSCYNGRKTYVGRTSGYGHPQNIIMKRYSGHHMAEVCSTPKADKAYQGYGGYPIIRGREQQLIDYYGGVGSPNVANVIRGVSRYNPAGRAYHEASSYVFGEIAPYTGIYKISDNWWTPIK